MEGHLSALIVSDSDQLRSSLHILLRSISLIEDVYQARDGPAALKFSPGVEPSLVLLDYEAAPNWNSGTLAGFRAVWPRVVCLVLADSENQVKRAAASGADVVLMKGVLAAKLLETIEELLNA